MTAPRRGWRTSELTVVGLFGAAIALVADGKVETIAQAVLRGSGCLALALTAGFYALSRAWAKRGKP